MSTLCQGEKWLRGVPPTQRPSVAVVCQLLRPLLGQRKQGGRLEFSSTSFVRDKPVATCSVSNRPLRCRSWWLTVLKWSGFSWSQASRRVAIRFGLEVVGARCANLRQEDGMFQLGCAASTKALPCCRVRVPSRHGLPCLADRGTAQAGTLTVCRKVPKRRGAISPGHHDNAAGVQNGLQASIHIAGPP